MWIVVVVGSLLIVVEDAIPQRGGAGLLIEAAVGVVQVPHDRAILEGRRPVNVDRAKSLSRVADDQAVPDCAPVGAHRGDIALVVRDDRVNQQAGRHVE